MIDSGSIAGQSVAELAQGVAELARRQLGLSFFIAFDTCSCVGVQWAVVFISLRTLTRQQVADADGVQIAVLHLVQVDLHELVVVRARSDVVAHAAGAVLGVHRNTEYGLEILRQ